MTLSTTEKHRLARMLPEAVQHHAFYHHVLGETRCGGGAFDGACLAVAQALQRLIGGNLAAVKFGEGPEGHIVLHDGLWFWDGFGRQSWDELVAHWSEFEHAQLTNWRILEKHDITYSQSSCYGSYGQWREIIAPYAAVEDLAIYFAKVAQGLHKTEEDE